jgi:hypothetical protein
MTKEKSIFYGHKGLIVDKFNNKGQVYQFLEVIEGKYTIE